MLKRIVSILLALVVLAAPVLLAGCAQDERTVETKYESEEKVVSQEEVVD